MKTKLKLLKRFMYYLNFVFIFIMFFIINKENRLIISNAESTVFTVNLAIFLSIIVLIIQCNIKVFSDNSLKTLIKINILTIGNYLMLFLDKDFIFFDKAIIFILFMFFILIYTNKLTINNMNIKENLEDKNKNFLTKLNNTELLDFIINEYKEELIYVYGTLNKFKIYKKLLKTYIVENNEKMEIVLIFKMINIFNVNLETEYEKMKQGKGGNMKIIQQDFKVTSRIWFIISSFFTIIMLYEFFNQYSIETRQMVVTILGGFFLIPLSFSNMYISSFSYEFKQREITMDSLFTFWKRNTYYFQDLMKIEYSLNPKGDMDSINLYFENSTYKKKISISMFQVDLGKVKLFLFANIDNFEDITIEKQRKFI